MPPLVSIIIPCYNAEKSVGEAIQSALDQSYAPIEVIVIDDGSTDRSQAVIRKHESKIRWESGPNRGGSAARNRGLSLASGDYIQFLDADDLLNSRKLERQVPALMESGADLVYSDWTQHRVGPPDTVEIIRVTSKSSDPVILTLQKQNITTESPLHKKHSLMKVGGFREDLSCCQELDLHLRLACRNARFFHLPEVLHTVRGQQASVSSNEVRVLQRRQKVLCDSFQNLAERAELTEERRAAFASLMAYSGRRLLRFGDRKSAKELFRTAFQMHPGGGLAGAYNPFGYWLARLLGPQRAEPILLPLKKAASALRLTR